MRRTAWVTVLGASTAMLTAGWRAGVSPSPGLATAEGGADTVSTPEASASPSVAATPASGSTGTSSTSSAPPASSSTSTTTTSTTKPTTAPAAPAAPAAPSGTFVGPTISTSYGYFQVQIVVSNGTITSVQTLKAGLSDGTSKSINNYAIPTLIQRVISAQSAKVSYVSGASYTSRGILGSVAGAISNAGL